MEHRQEALEVPVDVLGAGAPNRSVVGVAVKAVLPPAVQGVKSDTVEVGNVYANQHGGLYVVIALREKLRANRVDSRRCPFLLLDAAGAIQAAGTYDEEFFRNRLLVGRAQLHDFTISWIGS